MKLSVVIPIYNELPYVDGILNKVRAVQLDKEIIVVDDGSTDGTREFLEEEATLDPNLRLIRLPKNMGKGAALRTGFLYAEGDLLIVQDADLEYDPQDYYALAKPFEDPSVNVVYGSRMLGVSENMHPLNRVANWWLTFLTNLLFGAQLTDACTCYKVIRRDVLLGCRLESNRFEICQEITAELRRRYHNILEVPIHYRARRSRDGKKVRWTQLFISTWALIKFRLRPRAAGPQAAATC